MANKNYKVLMHVKVADGYDNLYSYSDSSICSFNNNGSTLKSINTEEALKELNTNSNKIKTDMGDIKKLNENILVKDSLVTAINSIFVLYATINQVFKYQTSDVSPNTASITKDLILDKNLKAKGLIEAENQIGLKHNNAIYWEGGQRIYTTTIGNDSRNLFIFASKEGVYGMHFGVADNTWTLNPDVNGNLNLGSSNHKWGSVYATSGTIQTSDRRAKNQIKKLAMNDKYEKFFKLLTPVSFLFNDGTSGRTHVGFISQDVEEAMKEVGLTDLEFAGFCKDQKYDEKGNPIEGEYVYSLRYDEFVALNTMMIQNMDKRMDKLEERLLALESKLK